MGGEEGETLFSLESKLIYSAVVAGKSARFADGVLDRLMRLVIDGGHGWPMAAVRTWVQEGDLGGVLRACRSGSYRRLTRCLDELSQLDLATATVEVLEGVHGIGPKTARFWVMWTQPGARYAALDTHILKYLRSLGHDAPKSTPQAGPVYRRLEQIFLAQADMLGKTPRELDYEVWDWYAGKGQLALALDV